MAATSTFASFLMHKVSDYQKLVDITEFPDLGDDPEMLETTTLSDPMQTFIMGIQSAGALTFNANYDKEKFTAIKALEGKTEEYGLWFGASDAAGTTPDGHDGKFNFKGQISVRVTGGKVNEVRGMAITIAPSSPIALASD